MYALVYWLEEGNHSVVDKKAIPAGTSVGEATLVTYRDDEKYMARVLAFSEDKRYLRALDVSQDGEIMTPKAKKNLAKLPASKMTKKSVAKRAKIQKQCNEEIFGSTSTFNVPSLPKETTDDKAIVDTTFEDDFRGEKKRKTGGMVKKTESSSESSIDIDPATEVRLDSSSRKDDFRGEKKRKTGGMVKKTESSSESSIDIDPTTELRLDSSSRKDDSRSDKKRKTGIMSKKVGSSSERWRKIDIDPTTERMDSSSHKEHRRYEKKAKPSHTSKVPEDSSLGRKKRTSNHILKDTVPTAGQEDDLDSSNRKEKAEPSQTSKVPEESSLGGKKRASNHKLKDTVPTAGQEDDLDSWNRKDVTPMDDSQPSPVDGKPKRVVREVPTPRQESSDSTSPIVIGAPLEPVLSKILSFLNDNKKRLDKHDQLLSKMASTSSSKHNKEPTSSRKCRDMHWRKRPQYSLATSPEESPRTSPEGSPTSWRKRGREYHGARRPPTRHSSPDNEESHKGHPKPGEIEIQPGSGVWVDSAELTLIRRWRKKPGEVVRKLMLYLIGPEKLVHMTARGSQSKKGIPKKILNAVKYYVDGISRPLLDEAEYTRILNNQIGNLRNPKPSTSQSAKVRAHSSTHDDAHDNENDRKDNDDDDESEDFEL